MMHTRPQRHFSMTSPGPPPSPLLSDNGYTGVLIRNEGTIRWFSNTNVFDDPLFTWVPVEEHRLYNNATYVSATKYKIKNNPVITDKPNVTDDDTDDDTSLDEANTSSASNDGSFWLWRLSTRTGLLCSQRPHGRTAFGFGPVHGPRLWGE